MVIKLSTNLLGVYVNDGPRHWEIGGKMLFYVSRERFNYVPDSFEVRYLLLL